jgi:undecaprenyl-diphosphatase
MQQIHDFLIYWDYTIWYYINVVGHTPFLDIIIPFFRNQWFWVPLYLFLAIFMPANFGRKGLIWCLFFILTFALGDYISATTIKPFVHRLRPCNNPNLASMVHLIVPCGSGLSFPSSHATNHFGLGVFMAVSLQKVAKWIWPVALFWAALVCYSQIYVGVHFPLDIVCGAMLGASIGAFTGKIYNRYFQLRLPD